MSKPVPQGWNVSELEDICFFQEGPGLRRWQYSESGFPFINIRCIQENRLDLSNVQYISLEEAESKYKHFQLIEGDLVMSSSGTLGRMAKVKKCDLPIMLNTSVIRFRSTDEDRLLSEFLPHFLKGSEFLDQITEESQGSAQVNFGPTHLKLVTCTLPPLPEQQKIAAILTSVDEVIESTQAQINKLKDLKTGMMQELLTKGIGHSEFKDSPVGPIPANWNIYSIGEVVDSLEGGVSVNGENRPRGPGEFGVLKVSAVKNGYFFPEENKAILEADLHRAKMHPLADHILFSRANTPELVGECGYVERTRTDLFLPDKLWMLKIKKAIGVHVRWLSYVLSSGHTRDKIGEAGTGTSGSMKNISKPNLLSIKIACPPYAEQEAIANALLSLDENIRSKFERFTQYEKLKNALMQDLLTGKVRVNAN